MKLLAILSILFFSSGCLPIKLSSVSKKAPAPEVCTDEDGKEIECEETTADDDSFEMDVATVTSCESIEAQVPTLLCGADSADDKVELSTPFRWQNCKLVTLEYSEKIAPLAGNAHISQFDLKEGSMESFLSCTIEGYGANPEFCYVQKIEGKWKADCPNDKAGNEPVNNTPVLPPPTEETTQSEEPAAGESEDSDSAATEPASTPDEPASTPDEPASPPDEPATEEPTADQPGTEEPASEEPTSEEPASSPDTPAETTSTLTLNTSTMLCAVSAPKPGRTPHALYLKGIGGIKYIPDGELKYVDHGDGTATLKGIVKDVYDSMKRFEVDMLFAGKTSMTPAGSPKKELSSSQYSENGGPVDTSTWHYFTYTTGTLTGLDKYAGAVVRISRMGPAYQVGIGASGKNVLNGAAGWFYYNTEKQPKNRHYRFPHCKTGDVNINFEQCADTPITYQTIKECHDPIFEDLILAGIKDFNEVITEFNTCLAGQGITCNLPGEVFFDVNQCVLDINEMLPDATKLMNLNTCLAGKGLGPCEAIGAP